MDYSKVDEITEDGLRLFKVMMRLEFALKELGYCKQGKGQAVEVAWDKYANEKLGKQFFENIGASKNGKVLIDEPPKKQAIDQNGDLIWEKAGAVISVQELIGSFRRVRNNLFHGGKSGDPDRDRNDQLISGAIFVADQILKENDVLQTIFEGNY